MKVFWSLKWVILDKPRCLKSHPVHNPKAVEQQLLRNWPYRRKQLSCLGRVWDGQKSVAQESVHKIRLGDR